MKMNAENKFAKKIICYFDNYRKGKSGIFTLQDKVLVEYGKAKTEWKQELDRQKFFTAKSTACTSCDWSLEQHTRDDPYEIFIQSVKHALLKHKKGSTNLKIHALEESLKESEKAQTEFRNKLQSPEFLEVLAELEHEQWASLIDWLIRFAPLHGEFTAKTFWENYDTLARTPYSKLTEQQKEADRKFARKVLEKFVELMPK